MQLLYGKGDNYSYSPREEKTVLRTNGRFSIVYKGKRASDQKDVVIKKINPRLWNSNFEKERFRKEYRPELRLFYSAATLDLIESNDGLFLVREYLPGIPLDNFINSFAWRKKRRNGGLYSIAMRILDCVKEIHDAGYIHADLKPSNFIYNPEENSVKVIDLGLSLSKEKVKRLIRNDNESLPFSFIYSPPEIMLNFPALINERSDIFSLGIIIYQLFSGQLPWQNPVPAIMMNLQLVYPLQPHRLLPDNLLTILLKATEKYSFSQPPSRYPEIVQSLNLEEAMEKRYPDVSELIKDLQRIEDQLLCSSWF